MAMFLNMLYITWLVFAGAGELRQAVTLLWTFKLPWHWAYPVQVTPWIAQFAFGFYSVMFTSTVLGLGHHVPVPPPNLVRLLSDGYHDTDDLHGQARKKGIVFSICKNEKMDII